MGLVQVVLITDGVALPGYPLAGDWVLVAPNTPLADWAHTALIQTDLLFLLRQSHQAGRLDRAQLQAAMAGLKRAFHQLLEQERDAAGAGTGWCRDVRSVEGALWTFVDAEGVAPTNNAAERALRPAGLWRKGCVGTQSGVARG